MQFSNLQSDTDRKAAIVELITHRNAKSLSTTVFDVRHALGGLTSEVERLVHEMAGGPSPQIILVPNDAVNVDNGFHLELAP